MNSESRIKNILSKLILISTALYIAACAPVPELKLENLDTAKKLVQEYYEGGQFDKECKEIFDNAVEQIEKLPLTQKSVVIFDVDETVLSNYNNTKEIGFGYIREYWHKGILKADEPAIKESKKFYDWLISKNIHVIFLTGRYQEVYEATIKNLVNRGFTKFDTLIVRSNEEKSIPAAEFKTRKREEIVARGYNVIASVGDQWSDLVGGNAGIKIKLPNYLYLID